jgi:hypothetical protein
MAAWSGGLWLMALLLGVVFMFPAVTTASGLQCGSIFANRPAVEMHDSDQVLAPCSEVRANRWQYSAALMLPGGGLAGCIIGRHAALRPPEGRPSGRRAACLGARFKGAECSPSEGSRWLDYRLHMLRWLCFFVAGGVVSGFAFLLVTGRYSNEGRVVANVTQNHGVHAGDVFVVAGWAAAMLALICLAMMPGRGALR